MASDLRAYLFRSPDFDVDPVDPTDDQGRPWGGDVAAALALTLGARYGVTAPAIHANGWSLRVTEAADGRTWNLFIHRVAQRPGANATEHWVIQVAAERSWWGRTSAVPAELCAAISVGLAPARITDARWLDGDGFLFG